MVAVKHRTAGCLLRPLLYSQSSTVGTAKHCLPPATTQTPQTAADSGASVCVLQPAESRPAERRPPLHGRTLVRKSSLITNSHRIRTAAGLDAGRRLYQTWQICSADTAGKYIPVILTGLYLSVLRLLGREPSHVTYQTMLMTKKGIHEATMRTANK